MELPLSVEHGQFINIEIFGTDHVLHQSTDLSHRLQVTSCHHPVHQQVSQHILKWPGRRVREGVMTGSEVFKPCSSWTHLQNEL